MQQFSTCMLFILILILKLIILHIRQFIKFQSVDLIYFINLPCIYKDTSVICSIHTYFENKESPFICYKFNKLIFNCNKLLAEFDIETTSLDS